MFIVFEGPEGCGKTTQARLADKVLRQKGYETVVTREPGGTPLGEKIRDVILNSTDRMDLQAELLLYMASRAQIVDEVIQPALRAGKIALCERFQSSSIVYQGIAGGGDMEAIKTLGNFATVDTEPDLTIVIDIDAEAGLKRKGVPDRIESRGVEYHKRVRQGFLTLAGDNPRTFEIVNGEPDVDTVHEEVMKIIMERLERAGKKPGSSS